MPIYEVQGPDGNIYTIEGPEGATADQLGAVVQGKNTTTEIPSTQTPVDETLIEAIGLKKEPNGQLYFEAPKRLSPQQLFGGDIPYVESYLKNMSQTLGGVTRPVVGGVRNLVVGLATLPADVISGLGSDYYQPQAEFIRENIPQVRQSSPLAEAGQAVTQYALPAGAAANAMPKLMQGATMVPKIVNALGKVTAAGLADAAVTDPNQASTIGDIIGAGPTEIQPTDSPMTKRLKVGAETAVGETLTLPVRIGQTAVAKTKKYLKPFSETGQREMAGEVLRTQATNPTLAAEQIAQTQRQFEGTNFKPITGESTTDVGLIQMQKGLADREPLTSAKMRNQEDIAQQFESITTPSEVDNTEALKSAAQTEADAIIAPKRAQVEQVSKSLDEAQNQMQTIAEDLGRNKGQKTAASEQIDVVFREVNQKLTKAKNDLFNQVDPKGTLKKNATGFVNAAENIQLQEGQAADALPAGILGDIEKLKEEGSVSFRFLVNMRQRISDEIGAARMAGQGARTGNLIALKDMVNQEINTFAQGVGAEEAAKLNQAFDYYADTFAPTLKQGEAGKLRKAQASSAPGMAPPSTTANRFLRSGQGQKERVQSLQRVLEQSDTPEIGEQAVRQAVIGDMADSVVVGGKINPQRLVQWVDKNRETLAAFPKVRKEVAQMSNRVTSGSTKIKEIEKEALAAAEAVQRTEKEVQSSALAFVIKNDNPTDAVAKILNGDSKKQRFKQILTAAKKDTTGQAVEGLRDAVKLWVRKKAVTATSGESRTLFTASEKPSFNGVETILKDKEALEALDELYPAGSKEMLALKQIRSKVEILSRLGRVQGTAGSQTRALGENQKHLNTVIAAAVAQNFKQNRVWQGVLKMLPDPREGIEKILVDAMVDPELARIMLLEPTEKNIDNIQKTLRTYVTNNILGADENNAQNNKENDTIPNEGDNP